MVLSVLIFMTRKQMEMLWEVPERQQEVVVPALCPMVMHHPLFLVEMRAIFLVEEQPFPVEQIKLALLEADVNLRVVRRFVNSTIEEAKGEKVLRAVDPGQQFVKIIHDKIVSLLGDEKQDLKLKGPDTLSVILLLGLQGAGKTTAAAKLAARLAKEGRKPLLAACDLVRPAAIQQLQVLGEKIGIPVHAEDTKDAVKVAKDAVREAKKGGYDTLIVDTAGRLQIDQDIWQ